MNVDARVRNSWAALFLLAILIRVFMLLTQHTYLHPDAEFQGLEPAYDLVWGGGDLPWEFQQGLRSWVWPAVLAAPMALLKALGFAGPGAGMHAAVVGAGLVCVAVDLLGMWALVRLLRRQHSTSVVVPMGFGLLYAIHPAFATPGVQPLIDLPASVALLWSLESSRVGAEAGSAGVDSTALARRRALRFGFSVSAAAMLRVQLWPVLIVLLATQAWLRRRAQLADKSDPGLAFSTQAWLSAGLVLALFGLVDTVTWGNPFASIIEYLRFNLGPGGSSFGAMPVDRYWEHAALALPGLRVPLLGLAVVAIWRAPQRDYVLGLAALVLAFFVPHQLLSYRVWRFVQPGLPLILLLAAAGVGVLWPLVRGAMRVGLGVALVAGALASSASALSEGSLWKTTWLYNQGGQTALDRSGGLHRAYLYLSTLQSPRPFVNATLPRAAAPGRVFLGQAVHIAHPIGAGPPPAYELMIVPNDAQVGEDGNRPPALRGFRTMWRDYEGFVLILERQRAE